MKSHFYGNGFYYFLILVLFITSCSKDYNILEIDNHSASDSYSSYIELTNTPATSALDIALRKTSMSRSTDYLIGLTEDDVVYIGSLNETELQDLKSEIMHQWDFESEEDIEAILDETYDALMNQLTPEQIIQFNEFVEAYIGLPEGQQSLELLESITSSSQDVYFNELCVSTAVGIDSFGRQFVKAASNKKVSAEQCKKYFAIRIALTSVNTIAGFILPGAGWAVVAAAVCDAASAAADYANCLKRT